MIEYSPTVRAAYRANCRWFDNYSKGEEYDPEGYNRFGYNKEGFDRANCVAYSYQAFEDGGHDLYDTIREEWGVKDGIPSFIGIEIEVCERVADGWWDYSDCLFKICANCQHKTSNTTANYCNSCGKNELVQGTAKRMPKYHAQIKGRPGVWSAGNYPDEAIGNLIRCHEEKFGIKINYLEGKLAR